MWRTKQQVIDGLVAAIMLAASLALIYAAVTVRSNSSERRLASVYEVGDSFGDLQGVRFIDNQQTIVVFVQSGCKLCTFSAPLYRRILALPRRPPVVVVGYEETTELASHLASLGVYPDLVVRAVPGTIRATSTPSIIIVSSSGKVERLWHGQLDKEEERSVVEYLAR